MLPLQFISFCSGSDGNCYYVGNCEHGILIDAGIAPRTLRKRLREIGMDFQNILGIFLTHDHFDHTKGAAPLGEKFNIPLYSTEKIFAGTNSNFGNKEKIYGSKRIIEKNAPVGIAEFTVEAFEVSHDGTDNVGYSVLYGGKRFVIATDLGCITEAQANHFRKAEILVIESNFDRRMLYENNYPQQLKRRIDGPTGHLCNETTAAFLAENEFPALTHVFLCHLSRNSNTPEKAVACILAKIGGKPFSVEALPRTSPSVLHTF